jgi:hypothetical protein
MTEAEGIFDVMSLTRRSKTSVDLSRLGEGKSRDSSLQQLSL